MRRRDFIKVIGVAAAAWPLAALAQQTKRVRRVGMLIGSVIAHTPESQESLKTFLEEMEQLGWHKGRNLRIETLSAVGNPDDITGYQTELATLASTLATLAPDVIVTNGTKTLEAMLRATTSVPIVFINVSDPVSAGFVDGHIRPGVNATGFTNFQTTISWTYPASVDS